MSKSEQTPILPITLPYQDKLDFAYTLLHIYSDTVSTLSQRDIDILAAALVFDVNSDNFKTILLSDKIGLVSKGSIKTQLNRLKAKELIVPHIKYNKKVLHPHMEAFKRLVHSETDSAVLRLEFKRNGTK